VEELAKLAAMSRSTFYERFRAFKRHTGESPGAFRTARRA
jgi:AraC-like DNA-binding protein